MRTMLLWLLAASIGAPAMAQEGSRLDQKCYSGDTPDKTIEACTSVIAGGIVDRIDLGVAFRNRGNAHSEKGQYKRALADYDHAMAINPADGEVLNDRGTTYSAMGDNDLAILDYDRSLVLNPANAMVLSNRCFAKAVMDRIVEGLADCNESLRLRPGDSSTLASRGFAYLKMGRPEEAIADYDAEIRINPGNPYSLFGRGIAKRQKGNLSGSDTDLAAAKELAADIAATMAKLGVRF